MTPTDLLNHLRRCSLEELRTKMERLQKRRPEQYEIVESFFLSCKSKPPKGS